jgi:hypothetical protein
MAVHLAGHPYQLGDVRPWRLRIPLLHNCCVAAEMSAMSSPVRATSRTVHRSERKR